MARRVPPILTHLLALLLCLQWGMAFGHCLAPLGQGAGLGLEICTAEGLRTLHLEAEGEPRAPGEAAHDTCPVCPAVAGPAPPVPALPPAPVAYAAFLPPPIAGLPPAPARAPPQQPRAPPAA
jgi:hypothetical protein